MDYEGKLNDIFTFFAVLTIKLQFLQKEFLLFIVGSRLSDRKGEFSGYFVFTGAECWALQEIFTNRARCDPT